MKAIAIFDYKHGKVRTVIKNGEPWFVARDIGNILELDHIRDLLKNIKKDWKGVEIIDTPGGKQKMAVINEPAVYKLAFRSRKKTTGDFTDWLAGEVIPSIRKTGKYELDKSQYISRAEHERIVARVKGKIERKQLTDVIDKLWKDGKFSPWMFKNFTDLAYRLSFGKACKDLKEEYETKSIRNKMTAKELTILRSVEHAITVLIELGYTYQEIKAILTPKIEDMRPKKLIA